MADAFYNRGKFLIASGGSNLNFASDTIKYLLVTSSYTFNADHNFVSDVSANELSVSGYVGGFAGAGRQTLGSKAVTEDDTNDRAAVDAADPAVHSSLAAGATIGGLVFYKSVTSDSDSPLLFFLDPPDIPTNGFNVQFQFGANGLYLVS